MKKLLLVVAALAVAAPAFSGTGGNPKPKDLAPGTKAHWGGDHSQATAKIISPKAAKQAARSGN